MLRQVTDDIYNLNGVAYYGKIQIPGANINIGELVFREELEPLNG